MSTMMTAVLNKGGSASNVKDYSAMQKTSQIPTKPAPTVNPVKK